MRKILSQGLIWMKYPRVTVSYNVGCKSPHQAFSIFSWTSLIPTRKARTNTLQPGPTYKMTDGVEHPALSEMNTKQHLHLTQQNKCQQETET